MSTADIGIAWVRPEATGAWSGVLMSPQRVECTGNETRISECAVTDYSSYPYSHGQKIQCKNMPGLTYPGYEARLIGHAHCGMFSSIIITTDGMHLQHIIGPVL